MTRIRLNWGSLRRVTRVAAFNAAARTVVGVLEDGDTGEWSLSELEALDDNRRFLDLETEIRREAEEILGDDP